MNKEPWTLDLALSVGGLVVAAGYLYASYVVGRFWREQCARSATAGVIVSLLVTPLLGWILALTFERAGSAAAPERRSLHDELQETYRQVDRNLHAHT